MADKAKIILLAGILLLLTGIYSLLPQFSEKAAGPVADSKESLTRRDGPLVRREVKSTSTQKVKIGSVSPQPSSNETDRLDRVSVVKVIDGDTITVSQNGKNETLRLIGIDTPETVDPRKPVQCFGRQASDKAKETLLGKTVILEPDESQGERDKYQRLLRYVFLEDGTNFNLMMVRQGFAHEYTYDLPYRYQKEFKEAQNYAMQNKLGLWSPAACSSASQGEALQGSTNQSAQTKATGTYVCDCGKLCGAIKTCDEAYYQLQNCGCSARDSDGDGVPCESLCR